MDLTFILVNPAVPENVGAAARALKTMGFNQLVLVGTNIHLQEPALWLAHGAADVLDSVRVFETFEEAIRNFDFCIATTAKKRTAKGEYIPVNHLKHFLDSKAGAMGHVAVVFGPEESGLPNEMIRMCDIASSVPMKTSFPSLNLAQAVMLYAWELSGLKSPAPTVPKKQSKRANYPVLRNQLEKLLNESGLKKNTSLYSRILERSALLSAKDINLVLTLMQKMEKQAGS